jgi:hypothetical protein
MEVSSGLAVAYGSERGPVRLKVVEEPVPVAGVFRHHC